MGKSEKGRKAMLFLGTILLAMDMIIPVRSVCNIVGCLTVSYGGSVCSIDCCENGCRDGYRGSECDSCATGYYMNKYETLTNNFIFCERCSDTCTDCTKEQCTECKDGYFGINNCDRTCPKGCKGDTCKIDTGACSNGCNENYYGDRCDLSCDDNCLNGKCFQNGTCQEGCVDGYYGPQCTRCSDGCARDTCDQNGDCTHGCKDGFYGPLCTQCPNGCALDTCGKNGMCTQGCKDDYYGQTCSRCPYGCAYGTCNKTDGTCTTCQCGLTGTKCDSCMTGLFKVRERICGVCRVTCLSCDSYYSCTSCKLGYYGRHCHILCPCGCLGQCDQELGTCTNGCIDPYHGSECDQICNEDCAKTLKSSRCYQNNGTCRSIRKDVIYGDQFDTDSGNTSEQLHLEEKESSSTTTLILGITIGVLVIVIIVTIVTAAVVTRKRKRSAGVTNAPQVSAQPSQQETADVAESDRGEPSNTYEDLTERERLYANNYQCLSVDSTQTNRMGEKTDNNTYELCE